MSLASKINGTFSMEQLQRLKFPVAWSLGVPVDEQVSEEAGLHDLADLAIETLQQAYDLWEIDDDQELEIEIKDGEIGDIIRV